MLELCKIHNLVLAEDDRCVLCRRPQQPDAAAQEGPLSRMFTRLLGLCMLVAIGELIAVSRLAPTDEGGKYVSAPDQRPAEKAADADEPSPSDDAEAAPAPQEQAMFSRAQELSSEITPANVSITMYTAEWCFICDEARDFLLQRGVTLTQIDIDRGRANMHRLEKRNPAITIPTFELDGQTLIGWNRWQLDAALQQAAQQRYSARN